MEILGYSVFGFVKENEEGKFVLNFISFFCDVVCLGVLGGMFDWRDSCISKLDLFIVLEIMVGFRNCVYWIYKLKELGVFEFGFYLKGVLLWFLNIEVNGMFICIVGLIVFC